MSTGAEIAVAAAVGAMVGSFLNVVAWRLPRGESVIHPGSHCPSCDRPIAPYDNVPVVSWVLLRGRCRHCGARISPRYPAVELITTAVFGTVVAVHGFDDQLVLELPFAACLIALAAIDFDHQLLPNRIVYPMAVYGLVATLLVDRGDLIEHLIAGAGAFGFFLVVVLAYPSGMGMGDVKLSGAMGLYLGLSVLPALLIALLTGTLVGLALIARQGVEARKQAVPFGVFLALGGIVALVVGPDLIDLYETSALG